MLLTSDWAQLQPTTKGSSRSDNKRLSVSLKIPPGIWRGELFYITGFVVRFVSQIECELVPQPHLLLQHTTTLHVNINSGQIFSNHTFLMFIWGLEYNWMRWQCKHRGEGAKHYNPLQVPSSLTFMITLRLWSCSISNEMRQTGLKFWLTKLSLFPFLSSFSLAAIL